MTRDLRPTNREAVILGVFILIMVALVGFAVVWDGRHSEEMEGRCNDRGMVAIQGNNGWFCVEGVAP